MKYYKLILIIIIINIAYFIYIKKKTFFKIDIDFIPDIIISPGGQFGFYNLGICHYIRNHFNIDNKKIVGFSAGSFISLFLTIKKEYINDLLKEMFKKDTPNDLIKLMNNLKTIIQQYSLDDFNIKNVNIASTNLSKKKLSINNNFLSIDEVLRCCTSSSFIPLITYKDIFYFYNNDLTLDGNILYKKYLSSVKKYNPLVIGYKMFGRHKNKHVLKELGKAKKSDLYQLYIKGYHDASINHEYFANYFSSSYSS
jgi:hypothetical protein